MYYNYCINLLGKEFVMNKLVAVLGIAALSGLGYCVGKQLVKKSEEKSGIYVKTKESNDSKFHKASMFAVGAIKTGADKVAEGINDIMNKDMVKKGEDTVEQAKETTETVKDNVKKEIENLKNMVVSINVTPGEAQAEDFEAATAAEPESDSAPEKEEAGESSAADEEKAAADVSDYDFTVSGEKSSVPDFSAEKSDPIGNFGAASTTGFNATTEPEEDISDFEDEDDISGSSPSPYESL